MTLLITDNLTSRMLLAAPVAEANDAGALDGFIDIFRRDILRLGDGDEESHEHD
ncbi:MAG TPA: hypothetical protein VLE70_04415 [Anaerolineae bacterium]|nr:hypothetical protein [Anaerolineae bacterium]